MRSFYYFCKNYKLIIMEEPVFNSHDKAEYPPMHTAEHLLNATMVALTGCARSEKNHIERTKSKCDYHLDAPLTQEQIAEIERRVNEVISADIPVEYLYMNQAEAAERFNLSRLPDDASDLLRIVVIGDYDACPCIGAHVKSTGEIGRFRITSTRYADGWQRIVFRLS